MQIHMIVNPKSGKGLKVFNQLQKNLTIPYKSYFTKYPKHATELAEEIKQTDPDALVIVVGGDGTINEVINGAVNSNLTIGVVGSGSGNDYARYFYCFKNAQDIERFVLERTTDRPDVGQVHFNDEQKYFINNSGVGFDALICERVRTSKLKRVLNRIGLGKLSYVYYVLIDLFRFQPFEIEVETAHGKKKYQDVWFVAASNQPYFGGGMKISPHSDAGDGVLEFTIIHRLKRLHFLIIFWKVFKGNHLKYTDYVEQIPGASFQGSIEKKLFGHVDGEVFTVSPEQKFTFSLSDHHLKQASDKNRT